MRAADDLVLLKEILRRSSLLETNWESRRSENISELKSLIAKAGNSTSEDVRRLAKWAEHLTPEMNLRHFIAIMVPFERLAQRTLRDDEFIPVQDLPVPRQDVTKLHLIPVLENIRSAFNVGAIFRTSECWGVELILLSGYTPDPSDEKTAKTAMGTGTLVPWQRVPRTSDAVQNLKGNGYKVVALETVASAPDLTEYKFPDKTVLLLGNERFGLDPDSLALADEICRIPVRGQKNSLNVGVAFGIAAYEFYRQKVST